MKYSLTVERTYRAYIEFGASSNEEAMEKAAELSNNIGHEIFDWEDQDYALCDEENRTIVDWG